MTRLPPPPSLTGGASRQDVIDWVAAHLGDLTLEGADGVRPGGIVGGQQAADIALAALDVTGYAGRRSNVLPVERRGASRLSPYIRHGLLPLQQVWDAAADAPSRDRDRPRDELMWQVIRAPPLRADRCPAGLAAASGAAPICSPTTHDLGGHALAIADALHAGDR